MKTIFKKIRLLLLLTSSSFLFACGSDGIGGTGIVIQVDDPKVERIDIPFREHGYSNFETLVIHNQDEYDYFISDVNAQEFWNNKELFLQKLQSQMIDFSKSNLLLYRITETSGSIVLTINPPELINNKFTIEIERQTPEIGTDDIANYLLAYIVEKNINELVINNETIDLSTD